jgi:hypothetical protein
MTSQSTLWVAQIHTDVAYNPAKRADSYPCLDSALQSPQLPGYKAMSATTGHQVLGMLSCGITIPSKLKE